MAETKHTEITVADDLVMSRIYVIRGQKVILDRDLASLYGVETRVLKQAVRRNIDRFPEDFMFEVSEDELNSMVSQFVIPDKKMFGGAKPFAFTEQGVAMLSSVLNSKQAIYINIQIMRVFTRIRQMLTDNTELRLEIAEIKHAVDKIGKKQNGQDKNIELIFEYIDRLQEKAELPTYKGVTVVSGFEVKKQRED
ncbi:ORF6N domain-containing protein [Parapedobacter sp. 2B3]|uniref:ORF6N domain-containing protein n=1 Tax=Parapedobacter sp. 2B3 TaxID=3342381 RepID=UPI0035B5932E